MLFNEYEEVECLRFNFLAAQKRRPDQFTVDPFSSIDVQTALFFVSCHPILFLPCWMWAIVTCLI
jgi:hypothetical protein